MKDFEHMVKNASMFIQSILILIVSYADFIYLNRNNPTQPSIEYFMCVLITILLTILIANKFKDGVAQGLFYGLCFTVPAILALILVILTEIFLSAGFATLLTGLHVLRMTPLSFIFSVIIGLQVVVIQIIVYLLPKLKTR